VKRFSRFQVDSPWRMRTILYMVRQQLGCKNKGSKQRTSPSF
jgi:hypothetical protein